LQAAFAEVRTLVKLMLAIVQAQPQSFLAIEFEEFSSRKRRGIRQFVL
jgi:squalene cyclase